MIVDTLERLPLYAPPLRHLEKILDFLAQDNAQPHADGRYELAGDDLFALVQAYTTKPVGDRLPEAHRRYTDLQVILAGREIIGWSLLERLTEHTEEFSKGGDIGFYTGEILTPVRLDAGMFALLFPNDAHLPCVCVADPEPVRKVVFKLRHEG